MFRCHKAYEAIELGNPLNALTDLTGDVCEHFDIAHMTKLDLYHMMYRSWVNRSQLVAWLGKGSLRLQGFQHTLTRKTRHAKVHIEMAVHSDFCCPQKYRTK